MQAYAESFLPALEDAGGDTAALALEAGLVDDLWTRDQVEERLAEIVGRNGNGNGRAFQGLGFDDYLAATDPKGDLPDGPQVAVVPAVGMILGGEQPPGTIGSSSLISVLRELRRDEDVRAVVLRVDSGGGATFPSDEIRGELERLREAGKPLVVSMGGMATSGGYMISLPADEIWAHPETVTGSIGVIMMFPTFERALGRLGVNVDGFGTTPLAGQFRLDRSVSPEASRILDLTVQGSYERFVGQVADARDMDPGQALALAGGRIWTGAMAADQGLVDRLGGLDDAVAAAAERAGLGDDYEVVWVEKEPSLDELLLIRAFSLAPAALAGWAGGNSGSPAGRLLERWLGGVTDQAARFLELAASGQPVSHCLCEIR